MAKLHLTVFAALDTAAEVRFNVLERARELDAQIDFTLVPYDLKRRNPDTDPVVLEIEHPDREILGNFARQIIANTY